MSHLKQRWAHRHISRPHLLSFLAAVCCALAASLAGVPALQADPADANWSSDFGAPGLTGVATGWTGIVQSTVNWNGTLVVAGDISHAGGTPVLNVVTWTGSAFVQLGEGLNGTVTSLAVVAGTLFAAGDFTASGGTALPNIARWTGSAWAPVGSGPPDDPTDLVLAADGSTLLLLGRFNSVDGGAVAARCIAQWDGAAWSDVGGFAGSAPDYLLAAARVGSIL